MTNVRELFKKINIEGRICFNEPLARHTTFRIGGPADVFVAPAGHEDLLLLHRVCREQKLPVFLLGAGANILVADAGIRGVVISLENLTALSREGSLLTAAAGVAISDLSREAAARNLGGLEFIYSMPGSVGGSIYMNARCYGVSVGDLLANVRIIGSASRLEEVSVTPADFAYKRSPFQTSGAWIVAGTFRTTPGEQAALERAMAEKKQDREAKGHFLHPCAGSVFKNNRAFGRPSGALIDSLGLKGCTIGGARVSDRHANIIVNTGEATARDVRQLMEYVQDRVRKEYGYMLEPELILTGAWEEEP